MNIGIDIDDTTVITYKAMFKYADIFQKEILKRDLKKNSLGLINNAHYLSAIYGWTREERVMFFSKYYKNVLEECPLLENADKVINDLHASGNKIYFITARLTGFASCDTVKITEEAFIKDNIKYDKLIFNASNKLAYCTQYNIQIFIDDSFETCMELEKNGIKTYLMTTPMNEKVATGNIERVDNWNEIELKIKNYLKENL